MNIIEGVANTVSYMHHDCSTPIVHRDISSKNVLLDMEYEAHVSDSGTAKFLKQDSSNWSELAGTYGYVAPGMLQNMNVTEKCDVYSFGVLTLKIIKEISNVNLALADMLDPRLATPSRGVQDKLISIMEVVFSCLDANSESRPTMQIVCQRLFNKVSCSSPGSHGASNYVYRVCFDITALVISLLSMFFRHAGLGNFKLLER
ncbi:hypothetical protein Pint_26356 [Pistacia integerrima]|uniref:Uncharacterized protein n=1 Tax=Pistacia integerrima TaxID=434235 RepID=A0ACC0YCL2_9ROSI|nr:hypothetical protein Pint_26356 [Pistacia integerrima]